MGAGLMRKKGIEMKVTVDVSEDDLRDALASHVKAAVADRVNSWGSQTALKEMVNAQYKQTVVTLVQEMLSDSAAIRAQISEAMVAKIKGQLNAAMKAAK